jgi:DNA mismatch repair ATPase MutS
MADLKRELALHFKTRTVIIGALLAGCVAVVVCGGLPKNWMSLTWAALGVPVTLLAARRLNRVYREISKCWRLRRYYGRGVERLRGDWIGAGDPGEQFRQAGHMYTEDLHVFGKGSLFELLSTVRTGVGRYGLARYLLETPPLAEIRDRQAAVQELSANRKLQEGLALLGRHDFQQTKLETYAAWLDSPRLGMPGWMRVAAMISSSVMVGAVVCGFLAVLKWPIVLWVCLPPLAAHTATGLIFRKRVNRELPYLRSMAIEVQLLREGLLLMEQQNFQSAKLRSLVDRARGASKRLRGLARLLRTLDESYKEWFSGPSRALLLGTQLVAALDRWRQLHGQQLGRWLDAWAEFEALAALANYAYENPANVYPDLVDQGAEFRAEALGHPLIPDEACIRNDVNFDAAERFYIVSGSNMSGKSTLMRAIGLNAVLAFAGAPVRARELRLSRLAICASIAITDSLLEGKSKFLTEIERLKRTIEEAKLGGPVLFLIDEILSGTNSRDRRIAAEAVLRELIDLGAIGALSTHDLALTEIAEPANGGRNVHMGSRNGTDPLDFDYLLKPGVTKETNALAIARMAGVAV